MKTGEVVQLGRADGRVIKVHGGQEEGYIALVAVPGTGDIYEVQLKALKSELGWIHLNSERALLLSRTLPIEIDFDSLVKYRYYTNLHITKESAQKWAEKIRAIMEPETEVPSGEEEPFVKTPGAIALDAIDKLNERITNEIFLIIENDSELKLEYENATESMSKDTVNQLIGKAVKTAYGLTNAEDRENKPTSSLIAGHQKLKLEIE